MRRCEKCGRNVENEEKFCPVCGTGLKADTKRTCQKRRTSSPFQNEDIQENKLMAVLAYFGFLVFIPLFAAKKSRFARYHVKQGLVLLAAELLFAVCYCILSFAVLSISWQLYYVVRIAGMVRYFFPVLAVIGILNALNGKAKKLPVIGGIL